MPYSVVAFLQSKNPGDKNSAILRCEKPQLIYIIDSTPTVLPGIIPQNQSFFDPHIRLKFMYAN